MKRLAKCLAALLSRYRERNRRVPVFEKFTYFRTIGNANDDFLQRLAGLQERLGRSTILGLGMVASATDELSANIGSMVESLVAMSGGRYQDILPRYEAINREIIQKVREVYPVEFGPLVIWPNYADALKPQVVGPKAARLAEIALGTGLSVPPFFSITIHGYRLFMETSGIRELVSDLLWSLDLSDSRSIKIFSDSVIEALARAKVPPALETELLAAYRRLLAFNPSMTGVAVRSSAIGEDSESSFAGQFESLLNIQEAGLSKAYRQVVASKYRYEALQYAAARGYLDEDISMPVLVMAMVQPMSSGVAYSRCPDLQESSMVTAVRGLAQAAVEGRVTPDTFLVSTDMPTRVEGISLGKAAFSLRCAVDGGLLELKEDNSSAPVPSLKENEVREIASVARTLEDHFGAPQDVEWAIDETGSLIVVQTRPLYVSSLPAASRSETPYVEGYRILARGARASGGVASGIIFRPLNPDAIETIPEGAILCVPNTSPRLAGVMGLVRGVVAVVGSPTGHMATVAREFGVPCLIGVENAPSALLEGMLVTLDADAGVVYEGEVHELFGSKPEAGASSIKRGPAQESLQYLLQRVAPLTLTEPGTPEFCPSNCKSFHDIARYIHQQSMMEMFELNQLSAQERRAARRLNWRIPIDVLLLDLGGGLAPDADRSIAIDQVRSMPLRALLEGMTDPRLRWAGPVGFDLKGFMSVVVRSAADDQRYGEPTYCLCSQDYVHFASRLAYHFSTVDSICSHSVNENYARFLFFGGAAVAARREWRAHFLATVLRYNGFIVKQVGDRIEGLFSKRKAEQIEDALVMLGRLMVASRHLDMVIESQAVANALAQAFLSGDYGFELVRKMGA